MGSSSITFNNPTETDKDIWLKTYDQSFTLNLENEKERIAEILVTAENVDDYNQYHDTKATVQDSNHLVHAMHFLMEKHGIELLEIYEKLKSGELEY